MTIQFLPPNPEQKEALDELEKLLEVLNKPVSKELKHNIKFVRKFTKSLFLAGRSYREMPKPKLTHEIRGFEQEKMEISKMPEISKNQIQKLIDGYEGGELSKRLATIKRDVPVTYDNTQCSIPNAQKMAEVLAKLGYRSLTKRVDKTKVDSVNQVGLFD